MVEQAEDGCEVFRWRYAVFQGAESYFCELGTEAAWDIPEADWIACAALNCTIGPKTGCRRPAWATA